MTIKTLNHIKKAGFLLPFVLYEDLLLAVIMGGTGLLLFGYEKIGRAVEQLEWREYVFFVYMFHMLFGEREFAYVGFEPLFVTEVVLAVLVVSYARDLFKVRRVLFVYYLLVMIGAGFGFVYFFQYQLDAIRDSFMLLYAFWVPVVYHVFRGKRHYDLFFLLLKLFVVLKAIAYCYDAVLIILGQKNITFEGFRFGVGYVAPSLVVISLFLPFKHFGWKYKLVSLLMIPAVFTMFHRSIFLGIFLGLAVIFLIGSPLIRRNIILFGVTSLALLIGFLIYYNTLVEVDLFRILEAKSSLDEGNINFRFISWQYVMEKFYEHFLIGYGVGKPVMYVHQNIFFSTVDLSYFQIRDLGGNAQPHNSYVNILARFGILIFPLFLYAVFQPLFRILRFSGRKNRNGNGYHAYSLFLLLIGFLILMYVLAFFNVVLEGPHHAFAFWLAIGMLLGYERAGNFEPKTVRLKKTGALRS